MADLILFCDLQVSTDESGKPVYRRVMRTKPNLHYEAGDRTGRLPDNRNGIYGILEPSDGCGADSGRLEVIAGWFRKEIRFGG